MESPGHYCSIANENQALPDLAREWSFTFLEGTQEMCGQWRGHPMAHVLLREVMTGRYRCGTYSIVGTFSSTTVVLPMACARWRGLLMGVASPRQVTMETCESGTPLPAVMSSSIFLDIPTAFSGRIR